MRHPLRLVPAAALAAWLAAAAVPVPAAPAMQLERRGPVHIAAQADADVRHWTGVVEAMRRAGELRPRPARPDLVLERRRHERADQYHRGVRVFGGDVVVQTGGGQTISVFGTLHHGLDLDTTPGIDASGARDAVERRGVEPLAEEPELVVLPRGEGAYTLTWRVRAAGPGDIRQYFVDAASGAIVLDHSTVRKQVPAIGSGVGVLGDPKKVSVRRTAAGQFVAEDGRRPPTIRTYDMRGDIQRTVDFLSGHITLNPATELAVGHDNQWSDGMAVDAHAYAGWTYDFFFKRFNRRGLDNGNIRIVSLVHPARRDDVFTPLGLEWDLFFANAAYFGDGIVAYGVGLPPGVTIGGRTWDYMSGALDIVAHELTHGITEFTSGLIYRNESGALDEAFADIMGTAVEFFYRPPGEGPLRADYRIGQDVARPGGFRSLADPGIFGDPDHYSIRYTGSGDNGGVHINAGIVNQAFYLAVEGGVNRTSGIAVQGVGGANRQRVEDVFYRAFTELLPSNATFSIARAATVQAARDLYGAGSAVERAVTDSWTAVGVFNP